MKMILTERKKTLFIIALAVLGFLLVYNQAVTPLFQRFTQQTKEIKNKKSILTKSLSIIEKKEELEKKFAALGEKIQAKLPSQRGQSTFLTAIGDVARETEVYIENMNPLSLRELGFFKEFSVEIDMEANLGNLIRFLYTMRESSVVLVANKLRLQPKSERSALLKGHLIISTIFLEEK